MAIKFVAAFILGYLIGAIPSGLIVGKLARKIDVREYGSGKTGFANVLRTAGVKAGSVVLFTDIAKGALAVLFARLIVGDSVVALGSLILDSEGAQVMAALGAIVGHNWSAYIRFRGGRGVDTFLGGLLVMSISVGAACAAITAIVIALSRYVSLGSILGALSSVVLMATLVALGHQPAEFLAYAAAAACLILFQHRENIGRLLSGTERKLGKGGERSQRA